MPHGIHGCPRLENSHTSDCSGSVLSKLSEYQHSSDNPTGDRILVSPNPCREEVVPGGGIGAIRSTLVSTSRYNSWALGQSLSAWRECFIIKWLPYWDM